MTIENTAPLTTAAGAPVANNQDSLTAGPRGPLLLQDVWFLEKLAHFSREVIPERRMHAKGSGAFGTFTVTNDISKYSKANIFSEVGKKTEMFARFSTVAGERGAADAERDIRGFSLKFYTEEGNWDLVGNNTPVFFFRDPLKFPDLNRAVKRSHTFSLINADGERFWVKFHHRTQQGIKNLTDEESAALVGSDRESHQRDLFDSIENGDFPKWKLMVQIMPEADAENYKYHPFDLTKVWSKEDYPLIEVGEWELNRNPENYHADVEQAAFAPANVVPGISFSPDRMLQGRLFSYGDAQRYRLGVNHHQIPVNAPKNAVNTYHRDGQGRVDGNQGRTPGIEPNSYGRWPEQPAYADPAQAVGAVADRFNFREDDANYFEQPGILFREKMNDAQRQVLFENTARAIDGASVATVERHIFNCTQADPAYGEGVRKAIEALAAGKISDVDVNSDAV